MSPVDPAIRHAVEILRCPLSQQTLGFLSLEEVAEINLRIRKSQIHHASGCAVVEEITAGLVTEDRRYVYPIQDGIVVLLAPLAIALEPPSSKFKETPICWSAAKQIVQRFYDEFGWRTDSEGTVNDTVRFVDRRPVVESYDQRCHQRVADCLPRSGNYLLDVASGPITHAAYLPYGDHFRYRICVDLSFEALRQARAKLGDRGLYLLADITQLPLADDSIDAAISLHTIYHVPADEQFQAIRELHRVIRPAASAIVVYSWGSQLPAYEAGRCVGSVVVDCAWTLPAWSSSVAASRRLGRVAAARHFGNDRTDAVLPPSRLSHDPYQGVGLRASNQGLAERQQRFHAAFYSSFAAGKPAAAVDCVVGRSLSLRGRADRAVSAVCGH